jgi:hypothetical protein
MIDWLIDGWMSLDTVALALLDNTNNGMEQQRFNEVTSGKVLSVASLRVFSTQVYAPWRPPKWNEMENENENGKCLRVGVVDIIFVSTPLSTLGACVLAYLLSSFHSTVLRFHPDLCVCALSTDWLILPSLTSPLFFSGLIDLCLIYSFIHLFIHL